MRHKGLPKSTEKRKHTGEFPSLTLLTFTKGRSPLDGIAVEQTRTIANVRIHVEWVVGNTRIKYQILGSTQAIDHVTSQNSHYNVAYW